MFMLFFKLKKTAIESISHNNSHLLNFIENLLIRQVYVYKYMLVNSYLLNIHMSI